LEEHAMSQFARKSEAQEEQEKKVQIRAHAKHIAGLIVGVMVVAALALLTASANSAQDKYSLKSPGGIALSDFKGYEDWADISSSRTDDRLKVIVGNPTVINAFKSGIPGDGKPFPDGSMIAKLQWSQKKSTEAPFVVDVPDSFKEIFVMEKDSKRFANSNGWGYAVFDYDASSDTYAPDPKALADCGNACHTAVKAKDYIFHPYQKR
jgi:hypothetical protein